VTYALGLSGGYFHDSAACLIENGQIIAFAEEERFTRVKHNRHSRSCARSAAFCLAKAGIRLQDVETIALGWNPLWPHNVDYIEDRNLIQELLDPRFFDSYLPEKLMVIEHHQAHAASAFYCSGFVEANVLVVDGSGDGLSTSVSYGSSRGIEFIKKYDFTQSLGWFYEFITEHAGLGDWQNAGKLMGLAAYGQPEYTFDFISRRAQGYEIDISKIGVRLAPDPVADYLDLGEQGYYQRFKRSCAALLEHSGIPAHSQQWRVDADHSRLVNITHFGATQQNLAASAQRTLEECVISLVDATVTHTGNKKLCIAGGTGLNCSVNGKLYHHPLVEALYVQPAAGDAGTSIGAAFEAARRAGHFTVPASQMSTMSFGPSFSNEVIYKTIQMAGLPHTFHPRDIEYVTAQELADGATIGWFQGPMEAGPRALGNRSILADPRYISKRDYVNQEIKHREVWRPLAPSILDERLHDYVVHVGPAEFMIVAYQASPLAQEKIPATIHVDRTMRPQTVKKSINARYASLLEAFEALTGVPAVLNTSFNLENEPIVCTPRDAIRTFCSSQLDMLSIGNFLVRKDRRSSMELVQEALAQ
jgi:carbamoyltransferase